MEPQGAPQVAKNRQSTQVLAGHLKAVPVAKVVRRQSSPPAGFLFSPVFDAYLLKGDGPAQTQHSSELGSSITAAGWLVPVLISPSSGFVFLLKSHRRLLPVQRKRRRFQPCVGSDPVLLRQLCLCPVELEPVFCASWCLPAEQRAKHPAAPSQYLQERAAAWAGSSWSMSCLGLG